MFVKKCIGTLLLLFLIVFSISCFLVPGSKNSVSPVWTNTLGDEIAWININYDGYYMAAGGGGRALLFDNAGNLLWSKEVDSAMIDTKPLWQLVMKMVLLHLVRRTNISIFSTEQVISNGNLR